MFALVVNEEMQSGRKKVVKTVRLPNEGTTEGCRVSPGDLWPPLGSTFLLQPREGSFRKNP